MIILDGQLLKNIELEEEHHRHELEQIEYQALQERMEETRRMRHDLKHHIHMVNYYLEEKEYHKLQEYINTYRDSIPDGDKVRFCDHRVINNIIFYFASQAKIHGIDFDAKLSITEDMTMNDHDLSVLLGNLLENAIDACKEQQSSERQIVIKGNGDRHSLLFTIDNTYENELKKNKKGEFITTKPEGHGIGVNSSRKIVERYNGIFTADRSDEMFRVSFMLNL